jgi:hypothetical protein
VRVVASGGPPSAKASFAHEWLRFEDAPNPAWAIGPNGKLSLNAEEAADAPALDVAGVMDLA